MLLSVYTDVLSIWQTYLSDPASITMEGILIFNKHLFVLFVGWLLFYALYYYNEYTTKFVSV